MSAALASSTHTAALFDAVAFDAVLFDLDGTLVDTAPEIADAVNDTLAHFEYPAVAVDMVRNWIGYGTSELLIQAWSHVTKTEVIALRGTAHFQVIESKFDTYYHQRCGTNSRLYPHVREALAHLRAQGVKLAVVTNKEGRYTRTVLAAHGLDVAFDCVISGDTFSTKKPDPAGAHACLQQLGCAISRSLFVGDSSIDAATARHAGLPVWLLPYGYNMGADIVASKPDRIVPDFSVFLTANQNRN